MLAVAEQLAGCAVPASALESLVLPARVVDYQPAYLDELTAAFAELADVSGILASELRRSWRLARVG